MEQQLHTSPVFEGSEKRLEVDFFSGESTPCEGLRSLCRPQLDALLQKAACCIVSGKSTEAFDSYVLSESSLFVYPTKVVLKTCGTTRLLNAVPMLLELAGTLDMQPQRCKYSRASYLFPELQPNLYRCFSSETEFLNEHFGHLGGEGGSYVLGDANHGLQWHIYVADTQQARTPIDTTTPTYTLEVCMTELCPAKAAQFVRSTDFVSAKHTTAASGIGSLLRGADIDDYVFEPCGYSMNGIEGEAFSTVHITPEIGFSYASLELSGYPANSVNPSGVVAKAAEIFRPGHMTVSLSVNEDIPACKWPSSLNSPPGYSLQGTSAQHFPCGGCIFHYSMQAEDKGKGLLGSPSTVLDSIFSAMSQTGDDSDREGTAEGSSRSTSPSPTEYLHALKQDSRDCLTSEMLKVVKEHDATVLPSGNAKTVESHMAKIITARQLEDPLYMVDLGMVVRLYEAWTKALPRVTPFYAVKCFTDKAVIATLAALGAGFDCASEFEMNVVLSLGVQPERIILANCCKRPRDTRAAAAFNVRLTTFDTVSELRKLKTLHPAADAVLRIRADDPDARCPLGNKYGAEADMVQPLLQEAKDLGLNVVGVSFHVGSAATNPVAFEEAIHMARVAFDHGLQLGFDMHLLDIGGGFSSACFSLEGKKSIPAAVSRALDRHFPDGCGVRVISEPGRYFTEEAALLACMVFGVRGFDGPDGLPRRDYWIPDGLYGSMNSLLYDHASLTAHPLGDGGASQASREGTLVTSNIFGPTCDGLDVVLKDYNLPVVENGDWLVFPNMGAYTLAGACNFNGMGVSESNVSYVYSLGA